jgi:hypothetical protein
VGLVAAGVVGVSPAGISTAQATPAVFGSNWPVYHHDSLGRGVDPTNTNLSPAKPAWTSAALDGQIYGEPLVEDGRVIVATENNTVYALAANTGAVLWSTHIAAPVLSRSLPCGDIGPSVGITSTPVIDPNTKELFVIDDERSAGTGAAHHLVGLNLFTGAMMLDTPADPPGSHPLYQLQRAGLTLDMGQVIIGYGGNAGDCETSSNPYHGWLVAIPETGGVMHSFEVASKAGDSEGAIWLGGAAPLVDAGGNIWVATGNSRFTASGDAYDYSDGVLEVSANLSKVEQYFAPSTWYSDNSRDADLGSSAPALMADGLALQAGKSGTGYALSRSSLGGVGNQLTSLTGYCAGVVDGGNAVSGQLVYSPCSAGVLEAQVTPSPPGISVVWRSNSSAGPPIVAGGLVWTINHNNGDLYGLDPTNGHVLQGPFALGPVANHFPTPAVADGLLLAAASNTVHAFDGPAGLPPRPPPGFVLLPGAATDIGVGANGSVWVTGVNTVSGGFGPWHWTGSNWAPVTGGGVGIAVDPAGNPWMVNSGDHIYHWNSSGWVVYPGEATDVGVGASGSVWITGVNTVPGGFGLWHWSGRVWTRGTGGGVGIAVDPAGNPWVVNSGDHIYHWNGTRWLAYPGEATAIGVGADGSVWVAGANPVPGGFGVWHWSGTAWQEVPGGSVRIAVEPNGDPWIIDAGHQILAF